MPQVQNTHSHTHTLDDIATACVWEVGGWVRITVRVPKVGGWVRITVCVPKVGGWVRVTVHVPKVGGSGVCV